MKLHPRKSPSLSWGRSLPQVWLEGRVGVLGCAVSNPSQDHSLPDTASLPCRKCTHPISDSYHILLRFLKSQPFNNNEVLYRFPPRKLTWKRNRWKTVLIKRTEYHKFSLLIMAMSVRGKAAQKSGFWINQTGILCQTRPSFIAMNFNDFTRSLFKGQGKNVFCRFKVLKLIS